MPKNMTKITISDFTEDEKIMIAELLHIIVKRVVKEVCGE